MEDHFVLKNDTFIRDQAIETLTMPSDLPQEVKIHLGECIQFQFFKRASKGPAKLTLGGECGGERAGVEQPEICSRFRRCSTTCTLVGSQLQPCWHRPQQPCWEVGRAPCGVAWKPTGSHMVLKCVTSECWTVNPCYLLDLKPSPKELLGQVTRECSEVMGLDCGSGAIISG